MSKITVKTNFRVVVEPSTRYFAGLGIQRDEKSVLQERDCEGIVEQIKRHVDDVKDAYVEYDTEMRCSYCGYEWEEENGIPQCCTKAQVEAAGEKYNF